MGLLREPLPNNMGIFLLLFQMLPLILKCVVSVEETIHIDSGLDKKKIIFDSIIAALQTITGKPADTKTVNIMSVLTDSTVSTLNAVGVFAPKSANQAVPPIPEQKPIN